MESVFTRILAGSERGRVVWRGERTFALLASRPLKPGHLILVPHVEVDHWIDLAPDLASELVAKAQRIARIQLEHFPATKVGVVIAGIVVRHAHLHLVPIDAVSDLDFAREDACADPAELDRQAELLRAALARV